MASDLFAPQPILLEIGTGPVVHAVAPTFSGSVAFAGTVHMTGLPTSNPTSGDGALWTNTNVVTKST